MGQVAIALCISGVGPKPVCRRCPLSAIHAQELHRGWRFSSAVAVRLHEYFHLGLPGLPGWLGYWRMIRVSCSFPRHPLDRTFRAGKSEAPARGCCIAVAHGRPDRVRSETDACAWTADRYGLAKSGATTKEESL